MYFIYKLNKLEEGDEVSLIIQDTGDVVYDKGVQPWERTCSLLLQQGHEAG